jgi:hypothetical protein
MAQAAPEIVHLVARIERFCARRIRQDGPQLALDLIELRRGLDLLDLKFSEMAAAFATTEEYDEQGSVSPIDWIRHKCRMGRGAAADRVAVGEHLAGLPKSAETMAGGEIGFAHLALIARTKAGLAESETARPFEEGHLLAKAKEFSVGRFRIFCEHQRHAADPEGFAAAQSQGVEARSLSLSSAESGMVCIRGVLDLEGGSLLRTALEPLARPSGKGDERKRSKRLADALVELAHHSLDSGLVPQRGSQRAHLQVTTTLETLLQRAGAPAADIEFSLPISAASVQRMACDCNLTRVLLSADSAVIDVGRSTRRIKPAIRRALNVRDGGCRWPGCDRPASWSEGHHFVHWTKDGPTNLPNLVLLCYRHHWMVHEGKWQLVKTDDGRWLAIPPQMNFFRNLARGPSVDAA